MSFSFAPQEIKSFLIEVFEDKNHSAYGQIATLGEDKMPEVRTVHIHYRKEFDALAFSAHTASSKWKELEKHPYLSGCYFDTFRGIQFRWESKVELLDRKVKDHEGFLLSMWKLMREEVRQAYWLRRDNLLGTDKINKKYDLNKRAPGHGVVVCHPSSWTIYKTNPESYSKGQCTRYEIKEEKWISQEVSILGQVERNVF